MNSSDLSNEGGTDVTYWDERRVWVTGGTGFLGRVIGAELQKRGAPEVIGTGRAQGDLTDAAAVRRLIQDIRPDIVVHLAASVGGIGANQDHPAEFFYDNLMMGANVLHESWKAGVEKVVAIGTICAYPKFT